MQGGDELRDVLPGCEMKSWWLPGLVSCYLWPFLADGLVGAAALCNGPVEFLTKK